jgi:type II protein arginine methyltransferase
MTGFVMTPRSYVSFRYLCICVKKISQVSIMHQALRQEIAYASYLNLQTMILPPPRNRAHIASYARAINSALLSPGYMNFCIRLPIYDPSIFRSVSADRSSVSWGHGLAIDPPTLAIPKTTSKVYRSPKAPEGELNATWEMWDIIRSICDYNPRLALGLFAIRCHTMSH